MSISQSAADQAANTAIYGGAVTAMTSGGTLWLGLTSTQWSALGVIAGIVVAVVGLAVRTAVDIYFRNQHLKLAQSRAAVLAQMGAEE